MALNTNKFLSADLSPRTVEVAVPELASFFDEEDSAVWEVRGLSGDEIFKANQLAESSSSDEAALKAITELLGTESGHPAEMVRRAEQLMIGSVEPKCDRKLAYRLFNHFPIVAMKLSNEILTLTGLGAEVGKSKASGKTTKSEARS